MDNKILQQRQTELIDLLQISLAGDELAYRDFLLKVSVLVRAYLNRYIIASDLRELILQEIMVAVHRNIHTFGAKNNFVDWLFVIIKHRAKLSLSLYYLNFKRDFDLEELVAIFHLTNEELDEKVDENNIELHLNAKEKKVIRILEDNGFSVKAASKELKMNSKEIKEVVQSAYERFRKNIKDV